MLQSKNDNRTYNLHTLQNGMRVVIIQDPGCKKSAAAMSIGVGHFDDPPESSGLTHLMEHMLFLGSKSFPQANSFNQFLGNHGGQVNAWTGSEYSNFHFEVANDFLLEGLRRLSDMMIAPLFDLEQIDKEIHSIDAEFKLKQKDDLRRLYQVHKETCNPQHPFSRFTVGNNQTLRQVPLEDLKKQIIALHQRGYVGANICCCIITGLATQTILDLLTESFSHFAKGQLNERTLPPLYLPEQLGIRIDIKPLKAARRVIITFALPDCQNFYPTKPLDFISHLLGDEGPGSLLALFKQNQWATNLSAGGGINGSNFKDFNINIQLTSLGLQRLDNILECVFAYLEKIRASFDETWRLQEKTQLGQLAFDYSDAAKAFDEAIQISNQIFQYPENDILCGDYLITNPDYQIIKQCLDYMQPDNIRLKVIQPDIQTDQVASWYQTPYRVTRLATEFLDRLKQPAESAALRLPDKNPYIVNATSVQEIDDKYLIPSQIADKPNVNIWFAQDASFHLPKGDCFISFDCTSVLQGAEVSAYKRLWIACLAEQFNNQFYPAGIAGLHYHLYPHQAGFTLHTNGFSQKQFELCHHLFNQIHQTWDFSEVFEQIRHKHIESLQNTLLNKPINRLFSKLSSLVQRFTHAPAELLRHIESADLGRMNEIRKALLKDYFLEVFLFGDWQVDSAMEFSDSIMSQPYRSTSGQKIKRDVVDLRHRDTFLHEVVCQHEDAATVVYFQSPSTSLKDTALTILTEQILASPFFSTMRTEKQLGYVVGSGYLPLNQHPGMAFYIQSPVGSAKHLTDEINNFLQEMLSTINDYEPIWGLVRDSVIKQLTDNDTNLTVKSQRLWMAIGNEDHNFNYQENLAETLAKLEFDEVKEFCGKMAQGTEFGKLVMFCAGEKYPAVPDQGRPIIDANMFKTSAQYID